VRPGGVDEFVRDAIHFFPAHHPHVRHVVAGSDRPSVKDDSASGRG
jgi:hypothetical protein